jgi:hypothetical protein
LGNFAKQLEFYGGHIKAALPVVMKPIERARYIHTSLDQLSGLSHIEYLKSDVANTLIKRLNLADGPSKIRIKQLNGFSDIMKASVFARARFSGQKEQEYLSGFLSTLNVEQVSALSEYRGMLHNLAAYDYSTVSNVCIPQIAYDLLSRKSGGITVKDAEEIILRDPSVEILAQLRSLTSITKQKSGEEVVMPVVSKLENLAAVAKYVDLSTKMSEDGGKDYSIADIDDAMKTIEPYMKKRKVLMGEMSAVNPKLALLISERLNNV